MVKKISWSDVDDSEFLNELHLRLDQMDNEDLDFLIERAETVLIDRHFRDMNFDEESKS